MGLVGLCGRLCCCLLLFIWVGMIAWCLCVLVLLTRFLIGGLWVFLFCEFCLLIVIIYLFTLFYFNFITL